MLSFVSWYLIVLIDNSNLIDLFIVIPVLFYCLKNPVSVFLSEIEKPVTWHGCALDESVFFRVILETFVSVFGSSSSWGCFGSRQDV